ncbi:MAG: thiamine phosphate synthase [Deltaproteobacteria bacterium]|nr:thiamine phosphate synthase [Deltaproteobacteria bacterium]
MSTRPRSILCAVLDGAALGGDAHAAATALFEAGVDWIQLRDRSLEAAPLLALARALVSARNVVRATSPDPQRRTGGAHAPRVVVNKRGDVALAAGADGVHLGLDALDTRSARSLFAAGGGGTPLVGASIHAVSELEASLAAGEPIDYVHLAPIWPPRSKPAERPPLGLATLRQAARIAERAGLRVFAQGGLDPARAAEAVAAGAAGIAVTGIVSQAPDRAAAVRALRRALDGAVPQ